MHIMSVDQRSYEDGSRYSGPLRDSDGLRHGTGVLSLHDGTKYSGEFRDGLINGPGVMVMQNGDRFEGEFDNGKINGSGVYTRNDGFTYYGEFSHGQILGKGLIKFPDGTNGTPRYEGVFENGILKKREKCDGVVQRAKQTADRARSSQAR